MENKIVTDVKNKLNELGFEEIDDYTDADGSKATVMVLGPVEVVIREQGVGDIVYDGFEDTELE